MANPNSNMSNAQAIEYLRLKNARKQMQDVGQANAESDRQEQQTAQGAWVEDDNDGGPAQPTHQYQPMGNPEFLRQPKPQRVPQPQQQPQPRAVQQPDTPVYQPRHRPGVSAGLPYAVTMMLRIVSAIVATCIVIGSGVLDSFGLEFGEDFAVAAVPLIALIGLTEMFFWLNFSDKSLLDLGKMMFTGGLGFGGYAALSAVGISMWFNFNGLLFIASHKTVDLITNDKVAGKIVTVTSRVKVHNPTFVPDLWIYLLFGVFAFLISALIGVFGGFAFTGKLFGSGRKGA